MFRSSPLLPQLKVGKQSAIRNPQSAICFVLLLLALSSAGGARAQTQPPSQQGTGKLAMTARVGFGDTGAYLIGEWVPVHVTLSNPAGGSSLRVRVQMESKGPDDSVVTGLYARDIDLPAPSRKEVTLYTYSGTYTRSFRVQVLQDGALLASVDAPAEPFEPPANIIVGVASSDPSLLNVLKGESVGHIVNSLPQGGYGGYSNPATAYGQVTGGIATVAHIKLADIPTISQALDSLGALVLDDVDTGSLSDDQRTSVEAWMSRGGTLVAMSRPGGADIVAGIANLLPVTLKGSRTLNSLSSLGDLVATPLTTSGSVSVPDVALRADTRSTSRVLAQQDGVPLVVERDFGLGHVVYVGLSPGLAPLKSWDGALPFVKRLLVDHPLRLSYGAFQRFSPSRGYYMGSLFDTFGGMFALPGLDLPSPLLIGLFLFLYIMIVGPVNFIILRRMRRAELAWITVPALVGLFSVAAYLLAYQSKGGDLVAIRANVANTYPGVEEASFVQHFGLFSPIRRTYRFSIPTDGLVTEMNSYGYYQAGSDSASPVIGGNPTTINNVNINTWSLKGFVAEHSEKAQSPVETKLVVGDKFISGTVKNRTNTPLQDVALMRGDAVRYIGYLAPGQQIDVRLDISSRRFNNSTPTNLLPLSPGLYAPQSGLSYPYKGGQGNSPEQRTYNRKIELLSAALYPVVADEPPADMSVIVLAWGPPVPANFSVEGHNSNSEELNVWADVAPVGLADHQHPILTSGSVPYVIFAPGNNPALLPWNGDLTLPNSSTGPTPVPTTPASGQGLLTPTPLPISGGFSSPSQGIRIAPYADVQYRLPAGTHPDSLTFNYSIAQIATDGDIALLAYNVTTGKWDSIGTWAKSGVTGGAKSQGALPIPNPTQYTGTAGDVTLRLLPKGNDATLTDASLNISLNEK